MYIYITKSLHTGKMMPNIYDKSKIFPHALDDQVQFHAGLKIIHFRLSLNDLYIHI